MKKISQDFSYDYLMILLAKSFQIKKKIKVTKV